MDEFVSRVEKFGLSVRQIRQAATDLAWLARKNGQGYLDEADRARVPAAYYRRATAYRKLGRFDDGLYEMDRAIDALGPGDVLVHEQFTQERGSIILAQDLQIQIERNTQAAADSIAAQVDERIAAASTELEQRLNEASLRLARRVDVAQEMVSSDLLKMVEILGLFVALVGFIAGSGAVAIKAHGFQERALSMLLVVGGSLIFFALPRLVTTAGRRRVRAER